MKRLDHAVRLAATDLSNYLGCTHITTLDHLLAHGRIPAPQWTNPDTVVLQELGARHEAAYIKYLEGLGLSVGKAQQQSQDGTASNTLALMKQGVDVITQAVLTSGHWYGRADVLRRVSTPSTLGEWSYEVYDCKLARETKAATILQLSLYSALLATVQGNAPRSMYVVSPSKFELPEEYLVGEYAAYYRLVKRNLSKP